MGWRSVVADSITDNINRFEADAYYVAPPVARRMEFAEFLFSVIATEKIKAVFPTTMYDLPVIAELRPQLEALGVKAFASLPDLNSMLEDKKATAEAARAEGLPILESIDPEGHNFSFPLVGKPRRGWGGRDIIFASTIDEFHNRLHASSTDEYIWQRKIAEFTEWSIDFAIDARGHASQLVKRRRVRTSGGYAAISEVARLGGPDQEAQSTVRWLGRCGALGLFNIQFLEEEGKFWLTDINPRAGTSSVSSLEAGVNLVSFLLEGVADQTSRSGFLIRTLRDTFISNEIRAVKGVVFDLDDTVIDQKDWMVAKLFLLMEEMREHIDNIDGFRTIALQLIDEGPWDRLLDVAIRRARLPNDLSERMIDTWRHAWPTRTSVYSDVQGLADDLVRKGIPLAIITDNPAASQRQKLAHLPSPWNTAPTLLTDDIDAPKPRVESFLEVSKLLRISPADLLFIGDSPWRDAVGALKAGYRAAIIVQRAGVMHNSNKQLFEKEFPQFAKHISWVHSLSGIGHVIQPVRR